MKSVLVMSHRRGFETDPVIDMLRSRSVPVFRFNGDSGRETSSMSFGVDSESVNIHLECDDREINGNDIGVGWCQQLPPYLGQDANEIRSLQNENLWAAHLAGLDGLEIPWFNKPSSVVSASNKMTQLALAQSVGLRIPRTLVSNEPSEIRAFAEDRSIVAKNLATPWIELGEETRAAYTKRVSPDWLVDDNGLKFCPVIYQEFHPRKRDYRVVVAGDHVFPVSCEPNENQQEDVRRGTATGESFEACGFDAKAIQKLRLLMRKLSIEYCAADFMEDKSGKLYFLETNICGAWWWVDRLYDGKICEAIADYLQKRLRHA